jgi:hypothetical protein
MSPSFFAEHDLFTLRTQLDTAHIWMQASSHQLDEARSHFHVLLGRLDELEQRLASLRSDFQERET